MDLKTFKTEADRLARPGLILRDAGNTAPVAYWHGFDNGNLCLSLAHDGQWLDVYVDDAGGGHIENSDRPAISDVPLFGESYNSLPPVDAVFLLGSDVVGEFLREHDWPRNEPFNGNFPAAAPGEYERIWQGNCPMYRPDIAAVGGGWHFMWPDGNWHESVDQELVAWTLRGSEPWVEVFRSGSEYTVTQRIT